MNLNNLGNNENNKDFVVADLGAVQEHKMMELEEMVNNYFGGNHFIVVYEKKEEE